jgi:glycosyltransferase involved in cell wall biosynthesis
MLLGMPIIATYAGGIPSILGNKNEGLLFQDGDPYSLAGAIIELIEDVDYANDLAKNARQRALQRHDPEKIVNDLLQIYSSII